MNTQTTQCIVDEFCMVSSGKQCKVAFPIREIKSSAELCEALDELELPQLSFFIARIWRATRINLAVMVSGAFIELMKVRG